MPIILLLCSMGAHGEEKDSVPGILGRIAEHGSPLPELHDGAWENPALTAERYKSSLSHVSAIYHGQTSERFGRFEAGTYLKTGRLTLQANASYDNGALHNVRECENADPEIVYPYWTYDTIGGNMNLERYEFGGSVNVNLDGGWNVGASGNYLAGLYYRKVDPRPRNVSGILDLSVGVSRRVKGYIVGLEANFRKYKQTCDIEFKSELGAAKIYHLTGLGTHYSRFAGSGDDSYYTGHRWGGSVTLLPVASGVYAHAGATSEEITHILTDLNKLPMAKLRVYTFVGAAGYSGRSWGAIAYCRTERRHGYENIFGDAVSNQYPQIGSLLMHMVDWEHCGVRGAWQRQIDAVMLSATADIGYTHWVEQHREPRIVAKGKCWHAGAGAKALWRAAEGWLITTQVQYTHRTAYEREMVYTRAGADYALTDGRYSIGLELSYAHDIQNIYTAALTFKF